MNRPHRRLFELTSQELLCRAAEYRRMASTAHGHEMVSALNRLAIRFALLGAQREVEEARRLSSSHEAHPDHSEIDKLIRLAERAAANGADPVQTLTDIIKVASQSDADPYLVIGVLLEGSVHTLESRIPSERQQDTAGALVRLIADRLQAKGLLEAL